MTEPAPRLGWTRSLRWRIQAWYAAILVLSLLAFGLMLYWESSRALWRDVDTDLMIGARIIDGGMRLLPPPMMEGMRDRSMRRGPPGRGFRDFGPGPMRGSGRVGPPPNPPPPEPFHEFPEEPPMGPFRGPIDWGAFDRLAPDRLLRSDAPAYRIVWGADGEVMHQVGDNRDIPDFSSVGPNTVSPDRPLRRWRGSRREVLMRGPMGTWICVGMDVQPEIDRIRNFSWMLGLSGLGVSLLGLAGGAWCLQQTLRPMRRMQSTANTIRSDNLGQRFDVDAMDAELSQFANSMNSMLDRLEAGFEQQRQFTADASHELRTPLAIMLSSAELALSRNRSAEGYRSELEKCQRAADRMKSLVDALLTLSRLDTSTQSLPMESIDLCKICKDQIELLSDLAKKQGVELKSRIDPCYLIGHAGTLERLVANLVINAIVYNREGGVVELTLSSSENQALMTVKDNGIGIPEGELPHLFKRFYRVDKARSRQTGGSGLGLAICDTVVQLHGGTIDVESTVGLGTTFRVRLPSNAARPAQASEPSGVG